MRQARKKQAPLLKVVRSASARMRGHHTGWIVTMTEELVQVDYPNNPHGPLTAQSTVALSSLQAASSSSAAASAVLLVFEQERSDQPVIVGLLNPQPLRPVDAMIDGKRVVLEGQDEIVLRCGQASITLRRNGRVVIRGTYVETRAQGVNRIRGGSVQIN